jgi:hypothetical protein
MRIISVRTKRTRSLSSGMVSLANSRMPVS